MQYKVGPYSHDQLISINQFKTGENPNLKGRNYGFLGVDPNYPEQLVLIAGTDVKTVFDDLKNHKMESDPWGQIERHIVLYDYAKNQLSNRFFSYVYENPLWLKHTASLISYVNYLIERIEINEDNLYNIPYSWNLIFSNPRKFVYWRLLLLCKFLMGPPLLYEDRIIYPANPFITVKPGILPELPIQYLTMENGHCMCQNKEV